MVGTGIAINKTRNGIIKTQNIERLFVEEMDKLQQLILRIKGDVENCYSKISPCNKKSEDSDGLKENGTYSCR